MLKRLTEAQREEYRRDGFTGPVPALTPEEATRFRAGLEAYERDTGKPFGFPDKTKSYLLFDWADAMVHHPAVLDAVEDVIGPDILVYHTTMWIKEARSDAFVLWHQDDAYFRLDPPEQVTAWVAMSDASVPAGCMRMIPGSYKRGLPPHTDKPSGDNLVRRGQHVEGYGDTDGRLVPLKAGELSLHNTHTVHASGPNRTDDRRMGLGISYIPAHARPTTEPRSSALLVRGVDRYRHYHPEQRMRTPLSAEARAAHAKAYDLYMAATRIPA
jgi:non-heme Fe2+,alpha-ketoglutarate-dependent halogenase